MRQLIIASLLLIATIANGQQKFTVGQAGANGTGGTATDTTPIHNRLNGVVTAVNNLNTIKVDKVTGKGLSIEDYTTAEKSKLAGIAAGATANSSDAQLRDRSTHTGTQPVSSVSGLQTALDGMQGNLTLTTTGSGAATLTGNTLNIPVAAGGSGGADVANWPVFKAFRVQTGSGYTMQGPWQQVQFATVELDNKAAWDGSTSSYVIPETGTYRISGYYRSSSTNLSATDNFQSYWAGVGSTPDEVHQGFSPRGFNATLDFIKSFTAGEAVNAYIKLNNYSDWFGVALLQIERIR